MAADLNRHFPQATLVQFFYVPVIRGTLALRQGKPREVIEDLSVTTSYDLVPDGEQMMTVYVRGQAYLDAHQGTQAVEEFQKMLDYPLLAPSRALVKLGIARAYALQGDTVKAKTAYQDFLALWKDADPDIPLLQQAKAAYAKLQ